MGNNQAIGSGKRIRSLSFINPDFSVVPNCCSHFFSPAELRKVNTDTFPDFLGCGVGNPIQI
jgi:hypothetical protein